MNRFHGPLQIAIGMIGDIIAKHQRMVRALADLRALEDDELGPEEEKRFAYVLKRAAAACGITHEELIRLADSDKNLEG